ncbi:MAG: DNA internalization-related competence protein ComEC/Rec2 [Fibrobacter sp.]|nr:DNA internalization-related competence protein ComEC/Rec2 [Fibrobacter sp.]
MLKKQKKSRIQLFWRDADALLKPLMGKPALLSAIVITLTIASIDVPQFAYALLIPLVIVCHVMPRFLQWVILISLTIGIASHSLQNTHTEVTPQKEGCGHVESVQQKSSGLAVIINDPNNGYKIRLTEKRKLPIMPLPGDSICYDAYFYNVLPPTVPGGFDTKGWLASQNLAAYGKFEHWETHGYHWIFERSFHQFRCWLHHRFDEFLEPAETGLLMGLLAGDRSQIPDALRSDFQRSGLVHVLAISGFHVVLLAGILMIFLKATGLPHKVVRVIAIALLFLYIPITGGSPAVRRAVIMFSIPQLGAIFQRKANTLNSLGMALLIIIIPEPSVIWNPGFQLSVAATAGILIGSPLNPLERFTDFFKKHKWLQLSKSVVLDPTYITLCATLSTAPFLVHHFKTLSPFAWLGNIFVVPAISIGMQAGLFALLSPLDILREYFCYAAQFFLRLATLFTNKLSDSTQASLTVGPFGPSILLLCSILILLIPVCRTNKIAKKYAFLCLFAFSAIFAYEGFHNANTPSWELTTIDVGQGDSHLLTTPSGKHFLFDAGDSELLEKKGKKDASKDVIIPYLRNTGVSNLHALIITHADLDHYGGAYSLIKTFPISELWISECSRIEDKASWQKIIAEAYKRGVLIRDVSRGFVWKENYFELRAIHPDISKCADQNRQSLTFRAKGIGHSALLTGDLTTAGEKQILALNTTLKSDILKIGHHGSKTSSGKKFIEEVDPKIAIISSGRRNRFRHPSPQIIRRLDSLHVPYLNTAEKGTINIVFQKDSMLVQTMWE